MYCLVYGNGGKEENIWLGRLHTMIFRREGWTFRVDVAACEAGRLVALPRTACQLPLCADALSPLPKHKLDTKHNLTAHIKRNRRRSLQEDFLIGAFAGAVAAAATTPFDVVKTGMMCSAASRPSLRGSMAAVAAQGPRALFRGVGPRALSSGVNSAVFFLFFEMLRTRFTAERAAKAAAAAARGGVPAAVARRGSARAEPELVAA